MGDRANIVIEKDNHSFPHPVFFYTHWHGYAIKPTLKAALLRGKERWNDGQYLARIIFCEMVKGKEMETTGFGITTRIGDGGYLLLCVNMREQKVKERDSSEDENATVLKEWTFDEFISESFEEDENS